MKKYRFGEVPGSPAWWKNKNLIYFFLAWNAVGFCTYRYLKNRNSKDTQEWKKLTQSQRYLAFVTSPDDEISVMKMKGLNVNEKRDVTAGEYIIPAPPSSQTSTTSHLN